MVSAPPVVRLPADDADILGHRTGGDAADHRHVVGAVDGDGDELAGGAVAGDGGEAVGDRLAGAELLDRGLAVVGGVGPVAGGGEREGAVALLPAVPAWAVKLDWPWSTSAMVSAPPVVRLPAATADILGHRTGVHAADHRHVVGAVDGDGDELAGGAVAGDGGEAVGDRLAGAELLDRGLAVVGGVGPVAGGIEREGAVAVVPAVPAWAVKFDWP